jgi:hypothetical protein
MRGFLGLKAKRLLDSGELVDQRFVTAVGGRAWPRPGQARNGVPRLFRRIPLVAYQVRRVRQARAVMAGDTVEEDRLATWVGKQVGGFGHLLKRRRRTPHRHE